MNEASQPLQKEPSQCSSRSKIATAIRPATAKASHLSKRPRTGDEVAEPLPAPRSKKVRQASVLVSEPARQEAEDEDAVSTAAAGKQGNEHQVEFVEFDLEATKERLLQREQVESSMAELNHGQQYSASSLTKEGFSDKQAEAELVRQFEKKNFAEMRVIGQFNKGFILARHGCQIFIVDQHATDEKYNYEMLQQSTELRTQRLIQPLRLDLTAAQELIVLEHLDIMHMNGFEFQVDEDAAPREKAALKTVPFSRNTTFGVGDVHELISLLEDRPGVICRPSRLNAMFASRACRTSLMIGTVLDHAKMQRVLQHASTIEQPWNCPHGRPTMRHLYDIRAAYKTAKSTAQIDT